MNIEWYQISIVAAIGFAIFELFTGTSIALGFCVGSLFVSFLQFLFDGLSINRDAITFAVVSFLTIVIIRKYFAKQSDEHVLNQDDVNLY
jgi:membrane protein implicated in regulation of membrane protease activity